MSLSFPPCIYPMSYRTRSCSYHRLLILLIGSHVLLFSNVLVWTSKVHGNGRCGSSVGFGLTMTLRLLWRIISMLIRIMRLMSLFSRVVCPRTWRISPILFDPKSISQRSSISSSYSSKYVTINKLLQSIININTKIYLSLFNLSRIYMNYLKYISYY